MFKVNNTDTRTTLFSCLYCWLGTYSTPWSIVFVVNFEQVNAGWERTVTEFSLQRCNQDSPKYLSWRTFQQLEICGEGGVCGGLWLRLWIENLGTHWPTYKKQKYVMRSFPIRILAVKKMVSKKWKMIMSCRVSWLRPVSSQSLLNPSTPWVKRIARHTFKILTLLLIQCGDYECDYWVIIIVITYSSYCNMHQLLYCVAFK